MHMRTHSLYAPYGRIEDADKFKIKNNFLNRRKIVKTLTNLFIILSATNSILFPNCTSNLNQKKKSSYKTCIVEQNYSVFPHSTFYIETS